MMRPQATRYRARLRNEVEEEEEEKTAQGQYWSAIPFALLYTFREPEMCTAGQRVLLTTTGPGPSFSLT